MPTQTGSIDFTSAGGLKSYAAGQFATQDAVTNMQTQINQNAEDITLRATKTEAYQSAQPNLSPFFESVPYRTAASYDGSYWQKSSDNWFMNTTAYLSEGWAHVTVAASKKYELVVPRIESLSAGDKVTILFEWRDITVTGSPKLYARHYPGFCQLDNNAYACLWNTNSPTSGSSYVVATVNSTATGSQSSWNALVNLGMSNGASTAFDGDLRISIYNGEYTGPYKPYSGTQLYASQAELKVQADRIGMVVSNADASSSLALTADAMEYIGDHVEIKGTDGTSTVISGGRLVTGSIQANAISASSGTFDVANIPNLSAAKITSGTIDAARIDASALTIGGSSLATQQDVDDISIGGKNLLLWSGEDDIYSAHSAVDRRWDFSEIYGTYVVSGNTVTFTKNANGMTNRTSGIRVSAMLSDGRKATATNLASLSFGLDLKAGDTLTFSCDVKTSGNRVALHAQYFNGTDRWKDCGAYTEYGTPVDTDWHRYSHKFTVASDYVSLTALGIYCELKEGVTISARNFKLERGNKATDWTPAPEDQETLALSSGVEYIAGTQTAATNVWTGVTKETALVAGKTIAYHLPFAGTSSAATLTLTLANGSTTAAIGVKYNSNNSAANNVTTHYGAGSVINMTYDGTYWRVSASYYDTAGISYARYRTQNPNYIKAAAACTSGHIICGTSSGYRDVAANVSFDLNYALMWCGKNIAANATGTENYLTYNSINVKTSGTVESATQYSTVYLKGTVDGKTFKIAASPFLTCKVPTSDDGFAYIPLGVAYNTTPSIYFNSSSDVYAFRNGEFQKLDSVAKYITAITDSGIRVHAKTNPTTNYAAVDADGMDVVKGGVSVAKFGETARLGLESGYHTEVTSTGMRVSDGTDDVVRIHSEVTQDGVRYGSIDIGKSGDGTLTSVGGSAEDYTEDDYVHHSRSAYLTAMASTESDGAWVEAWAKHASTWDEDDTGITLRGKQLDLWGPNGEGYGSVSMENAGKVISTQSGMVSQSISAAANAVTTHTVTFPNPYDVAPIVVACFYSTSSAAAFGGLSLAVSAITTTSFTVKIFNNTGTGRSPGLFWIATPQTSQT